MNIINKIKNELNHEISEKDVIVLNYKIDTNIKNKIKIVARNLLTKMYDRQLDLNNKNYTNRLRKIELGLKSELLFFYFIKDNFPKLMKYINFSGLIDNFFSNKISNNIDKYDLSVKVGNEIIKFDIKSSIENNINNKYSVNKYGEYVVKWNNKEYKYKNFKTYLLKNRNFIVLPDQSIKDFTIQILYDKFQTPYLAGIIDKETILKKENLRNLKLDNNNFQKTYMSKIKNGYPVKTFFQLLEKEVNLLEKIDTKQKFNGFKLK